MRGGSLVGLPLLEKIGGTMSRAKKGRSFGKFILILCKLPNGTVARWASNSDDG